MKILCFSDSHGFHEQLIIPPDIDMIICAGDIGNAKNLGINANECTLFLSWFSTLPIKYKVLIAGNHDTSIEKGLTDLKSWNNIIYLEHETIRIDYMAPVSVKTLKIFGSPYTPTFGEGWAYNVNRQKIDQYWKDIPEGTDIVITHGPPKGILDISYNRYDELEMCGDKALLNHIERVKPKYHIFGHIHDHRDCINHGTRNLGSTTFINASGVLDGKFDKGLVNQGIIIEI